MTKPSGRDQGITGAVDAVMPQDMAKYAEWSGAKKAAQDGLSLLALAALAGAYIAFGATFAAAVTAGYGDALPVGLGNLFGGLAFCLAYVLAIVGGAELFTTNVLMVMAWAHGRLPTLRLLRIPGDTHTRGQTTIQWSPLDRKTKKRGLSRMALVEAQYFAVIATRA